MQSVEAAVRREVMEEAGVEVGEIAIWGTQPWPIGRFGACELMVRAHAHTHTHDTTQVMVRTRTHTNTHGLGRAS